MLKISSSLLILCLYLTFLLNAQHECGDHHFKSYQAKSISNSSSVILDHIPIVLTSDQITPIYLKFHVTSTKDISSFVSRMYNFCAPGFLNVNFYDNGQGEDQVGGDGIFTAEVPICYNRKSPFPVDFELNRLRTTITYIDGTFEGFITRLGSFYIQSPSEYGSEEIQELQHNGYSIRKTEHIANIIMPRSYHPLLQDFDQDPIRAIINELWSDGMKVISLYATFFDTNLNTNSFSAFFMAGVDVIQTFGSFSNGLFNHELNHKWVNSLNTFGLPSNNGHWGFIERPTSAFGQGCFAGAFSSLSSQGNDIGYTTQFSNSADAYYFSDIELALMGLNSLDEVDFPIRYASTPTNCEQNVIVGSAINNIDKETFESFLNQRKPEQISHELGFKFVVLSDQPMSDLEIRFLSKKVEDYASFYNQSTQGLGTLNTQLGGSVNGMVDQDQDGFAEGEDCDDLNPAINPGAEEIVNNDIDENCDGKVVIIDNDNDGFHSSLDCDDTDMNINPEAVEIPNNNIDENCDGLIEIIDNDGDGFNSDIDCNDMDAAINPGMEEILNNDVDENCDGILLVDPTAEDKDGDGFNMLIDCNDLDPLINPNANEIYNNNVDENCDGCKCK